MNPNFQVYAKILKFALIYRNGEGTGLVLTVLQSWCFFYALLSRFCYMAVKFEVILTRLPHGLEMETFQ
jgi:hypothetical protein